MSEKDAKPGSTRRVRTIDPHSENALNDDGNTETRRMAADRCRSNIECSSSSDSSMSDRAEYDTDFEDFDITITDSTSNDGDEEAGASHRTEAEDVNTPNTEISRQELEAHHESMTIVRNIKKSTKVKRHGRDARSRILHELREVENNPPPNCAAQVSDDIFHWTATILGPAGTVYEGGTFSLDIRFPQTYPFRPPRIRFTTRIYHCNIDGRGYICLDILNEKWSPVLTISKVLLSIWLLLCECNPEDPLVVAIAEQYALRRLEHDKMARIWVKKYALAKTEANGVKLEKTEMTAEVSQQTVAAEISESQASTSESVSTQVPDYEENGNNEDEK